jgi:hypothetical protein
MRDYICMDWRHLRELLGAGAKTYGDLQIGYGAFMI